MLFLEDRHLLHIDLSSLDEADKLSLDTRCHYLIQESNSPRMIN